MLAHLAAFLLGLLAGAMLVIAIVLVPFWSALPPAELRGWFARHAGRTGALMFPLGGTALVAALAACVTRRTSSAVVAAVAAAGVVAVTLLVNEPANQRFAGPVYLSDADTVALLGRWRRWHWLRVGLGLVAFVAAVVAGGGMVFSVQGGHIHLIAGAEGRAALSRGVRGLPIRVARTGNRALARRGVVSADL